MNKTKIEWTDYTWNPVTGCHKVSPGCKHCYAETLTKRFGKQWKQDDFRNVQTHPERLNEPIEKGAKLHGKKVFVCDMSDLLHHDVPLQFIISVINVIRQCPDTIFQILTKRADRLFIFDRDSIPLPPNVWIGVSCEDQNSANERIPKLLEIEAKVRFLSCEPLIEAIDLEKLYDRTRYRGIYWGSGIHWVIAGGESGHGARPMHPNWIKSLRDQCLAEGVPFFFKQWGNYVPMSFMGGDFDVSRAVHVGTFEKPELMYRTNSKSLNLLDGIQHLNFPA